MISLDYINLLNKYKTVKEFQNNLPKVDVNELKNVYIFGTATSAEMLYYELCKSGIEPVGFVTNFKKENNEFFLGKKIFHPNDLIFDKDNISIIVTSTSHCKLVINQLITLGFKSVIPYYSIWANILSFENNQLLNNLSITEDFHFKLLSFEDLILNKDKYLSLYKYFEDDESLRVLDNLMKYRITLDGDYLLKSFDANNPQYFDKEIIKLNENEVFVDGGGGWNASASIEFIKKANRKFKQILYFEPDSKNLKSAKSILNDHQENTKFYELGLYSKKTTMKFQQDNGPTSKLVEKEEDGIQVELVDLDSFDDNITFIKMDIEGAEKEALIGAEKHLRNNAKLAITIYHKVEDIYEIPQLIKDINPNYKFYLRHYTPSFCETVLYAVPY